MIICRQDCNKFKIIFPIFFFFFSVPTCFIPSLKLFIAFFIFLPENEPASGYNGHAGFSEPQRRIGLNEDASRTVLLNETSTEADGKWGSLCCFLRIAHKILIGPSHAIKEPLKRLHDRRTRRAPDDRLLYARFLLLLFSFEHFEQTPSLTEPAEWSTGRHLHHPASIPSFVPRVRFQGGQKKPKQNCHWDF